MNKIFHKTVSTVFGLGMAPFAPGTFGALGAVLFLYILKLTDTHLGITVYSALIVALTLLGTWSTSHVIKEWGDDPSRVVVDEFVGLLIAIYLLPLSHMNIWGAFILFRFFDILKPLGIRYLDTRIKGAWGVMLDDALAGIYSFLVLHAIHTFF